MGVAEASHQKGIRIVLIQLSTKDTYEHDKTDADETTKFKDLPKAKCYFSTCCFFWFLVFFDLLLFFGFWYFLTCCFLGIFFSFYFGREGRRG